MPMRPRIDALPTQVRAQLDQRLAADGYGGIVAASAWLRSLGYPIGKSAVGIHAKRLKAQLGDAVPEPMTGPTEGVASRSVRLACLDIAARMHGKAAPSAAVTIEAAAKLEAWVLGSTVER